jgi:hypothetical protein
VCLVYKMWYIMEEVIVTEIHVSFFNLMGSCYCIILGKSDSYPGMLPLSLL